MVWLYAEIGEKIDIEFFADTHGVPDVCRFFCGSCGFKNLKVWTKSFRMVSSGALCDKTSLLWLSAKLSEFE